MASDNPQESLLREESKDSSPAATFLTIGTAVSAKYRGAFCEATVDKVAISFKLRVQLKASKNIVCVEQNDLVSGEPAVGSEVTVRVPGSADGSKSSLERVGTVLRVIDTTLYTVVFDDGDKRTLRRTQLVNKGERHFKESESLDCLPLTNPEQFRQPVIDKKKARAEDRVSSDEEKVDTSKDSSELSSPPSSSDHVENPPSIDRSSNTSLKESSSFSHKKVPYASLEATTRKLLGRVVLVDMPVTNKDILSPTGDSSNSSLTPDATPNKRRFTPGLVVLPSAMPGIDLRPSSKKTPMLLVRSFKDNRFMPVPSRYAKRLRRPEAVELAHSHLNLRTAFERAILWLDCYELPASWGEDAMQSLLGTSDWRTGRHLHRIESKSTRQESVESSSDDDDDEDDDKSPRQRIQRSTSTPKRPLSAGKSSSILARKRVLSSVSSKAASGASKRAGALKKHRSDSSQPLLSKGPVSKVQRRPVRQRKHSSEDDQSTSQSSSDSDTSSVDFETRDRWTAQLYRFMDEGGTPINKAPSLANKDLDLYKLYKLVRKHGGYHRVTSQLKWGYIYSKLGLPHNFSAGPRNLQAAFRRYLFPLDDICRKLGTDLDALPLSRPRATSSSFAGTAPRSAGSGRTPSTKQQPSSAAKLTPPTTEHSTEPTLESSPPVLSPPVTDGHTPSPRADSPEEPPSIPDRPSAKRLPAQGRIDTDESVPCRSKDTAESTPIKLARHNKPIPTPDSASIKSVSSSMSSSSSRTKTGGKRDSIRPEPWTLSFAMSEQGIDEIPSNQVIPIGSRVRVRSDRMAYEARILKHVRPQTTESWSSCEPTSPSASELKYRIHYVGWNARYDEVVSRKRIVSIIEWAQPADSDRPPSCSSLNLAIERSRPSKATASDPGDSGSPQERSHSVKSGRDDESDQSQAAETASDIVTTAAPMVRRRRMPAGSEEELSHQRKRQRIRDTDDYVDEGDQGSTSRSVLKRESNLPVVVKTDPDRREALTEQSLCDPSSSGPSATKRSKVEVETTGKLSKHHTVDKEQASKTRDDVLLKVKSLSKTSDKSQGLVEPKRSSSKEHTRMDSVKSQSTAASVTKLSASTLPAHQAHSKEASHKMQTSSKQFSDKSSTERLKSSDVRQSIDVHGDRKSSTASHSSASTGVKSKGKHNEQRASSPQPHKASKPSSSKFKSEYDDKSEKKVHRKPAVEKASGEKKSSKEASAPKLKKSIRDSSSSDESDSPAISRSRGKSKSDKKPSAKPPASPSSSSQGSDSDTGSDFGAIDALPRLTRNQHRQLLGDTPPGALLQTAAPVSTGSPPDSRTATLTPSCTESTNLKSGHTAPAVAHSTTGPPRQPTEPIATPSPPPAEEARSPVRLRPRQKSPRTDASTKLPPTGRPTGDDDSGSISTEPMTMSPSPEEEEGHVVSSDESNATTDRDSVARKSDDDLSSIPSEGPHRKRAASGTQAVDVKPSRSVNRSGRTRRTSSTSSSVTTDVPARKLSTNKRTLAGSRGSVPIDRSPTPAPDSPSYPRPSTSCSNQSQQPSTSRSDPVTRLSPARRRFGGPFYPIPGYDEMTIEQRCLELQERIRLIVESWREAKQYLKDLDLRGTNQPNRRPPRCRPASTDQAAREESGEIVQPA